MRFDALVDKARKIGAHPAIEPSVALVLRARTVHGTLGFVLREVAGRRETRSYRLRRGGLTTLIRHGTPDQVTLGEVFHNSCYALPDTVERLLGPCDRECSVLDLGANVGLFGLWMLAGRPNARIEAFEPDPANLDMLRRVIALNGRDEQWQVVAAAASNSNGEIRFRTGDFACSQADETAATSVPAVDVMARVANADLVKMDIEGGEWAILADPRFASSPPRVLVLEYHPEGAPAGTSPRVAVENRLRDCGYTIEPIFHEPSGVGMLWAWL